jgi:hypothetical protein
MPQLFPPRLFVDLCALHVGQISPTQLSLILHEVIVSRMILPKTAVRGRVKEFNEVTDSFQNYQRFISYYALSTQAFFSPSQSRDAALVIFFGKKKARLGRASR